MQNFSKRNEEANKPNESHKKQSAMDSLTPNSPSETHRSIIFTKKDGSVRSATITTEASTPSKRSLPSLSLGLPAGWESPSVEFALNGSLTDCSKLSSDCGSSKTIEKYHDPLAVDQRNHFVDTTTTSVQRLDSRGAIAEPLDDSFFVSYESNLNWGIEDESSTSQDSQTEVIPIVIRGRSMIQQDQRRPIRGRSADSTDVRIVASRPNFTTDPSSHRCDSHSNTRVGNNTLKHSHHSKSSKNEGGTTHNTMRPHRRGSSLSRTSVSTEVQEHPSRFARSKRKSFSRKSSTSFTGSESSKATSAAPTAAARRPSSSKRLMHSNSMPVEGSHTNAYSYVSRPEQKMGKGQNQCASSPYDLHKTDTTYLKSQNPAAAISSAKQKVVHPLTARILAESKLKGGQSSTQRYTKKSQDFDRAFKTEALRTTFRNETEPRRRLEKHQSFDSPIRKSKNIRHHDAFASCDAPFGDEVGDAKPRELMRPKIVTSQSFPESPSRRQKPFKISHLPSSDRTCHDNIRDLHLRFDEELQISPLTQSSREKQKCMDRRNGQKIHAVGSEKARNVTESKNVTVQRHEPKHRAATSKRDEANAAISNYFTPRHPTPLRNDNPDDSAFWHIDPNAFNSLVPPRNGGTTTECTKPMKSSSSNKRFV